MAGVERWRGGRRPVAVLLALALAALVLMASPVHAGAAPRPVAHGAVVGQEPDAPADDGTGGSADDEVDENPQPGAPDQNIIPRPNSGREPTEAGDRGGALQILVFVALVAGVGTIAFLAARDMRRSRARAAQRAPSPPNRPNPRRRPPARPRQPSGPYSSQASGSPNTPVRSASLRSNTVGAAVAGRCRRPGTP